MQVLDVKNRCRIGIGLLGLLLALGITSVVEAAEGPTSHSPLTGVVNVNRASAAELQLLPGVGPARARAIIEARETQGDFRSLDDLASIEGIGPASLRALRPHIVLEGETTARRRVAPKAARP